MFAASAGCETWPEHGIQKIMVGKRSYITSATEILWKFVKSTVLLIVNSFFLFCDPSGSYSTERQAQARLPSAHPFL